MSILQLHNFTLSIGKQTVCRDLNLQIQPDQHWGVLGRNGVGKTTLLHSLLGFRAADSGDILIGDRPLAQLSRRELAMEVGILFQQAISMVPATVMETVMLGRHPHVQSFILDDAEDIRITRQTLQALQLTDLADRQLDTLSGGESQRVALAMLIAQAPRLFLLDEPSNHLDVAFQVKMMGILRRAMQENHAGMLMATHDINLAASFCDHIMLLLGEGETLAGPTQDILTEANLSRAYGCEIRAVSTGESSLFYPAT